MRSRSSMRSLACRASIHFRVSAWAIWSTSTVSKGFLRISRLSVWPEPAGHVVPGIIGVGGADDGLQVGRRLARCDRGFRCHPNPAACARPRTPGRRGHPPPTPFAPAPALPGPGGRNRFESRRVPRFARRLRRTVQPRRSSSRSSAVPGCAEDLAEILVDGRVVIDDQDARNRMLGVAGSYGS